VQYVQCTSWHIENKYETVATKTHSIVEMYVDLYRNVEARLDTCFTDKSLVATPLKPL
jgi:hypothetical protein